MILRQAQGRHTRFLGYARNDRAMLGMAVERERGKGPTSEGFGGKCSRMHHCALFVAGGLFQGVADGALNRYFWRTFRDEMGVRWDLAGGRLSAR